jgi:hypothetical protein
MTSVKKDDRVLYQWGEGGGGSFKGSTMKILVKSLNKLVLFVLTERSYFKSSQVF